MKAGRPRGRGTATLKARTGGGGAMRALLAVLLLATAVPLVLLAEPATASPYVWREDPVDSRGVIEQASIALDADGNPHLAYYESLGKDLRYGHWNDSAWILEDVDTQGDVGGSPSIMVDSSGTPSIVYVDVTTDSLKHAVRVGTTWQTTVIDSMGPGYAANIRMASARLGPAGSLHACYYAGAPAGDSVKHAWTVGGSWENETVATSGLNDGFGVYCSIALDQNEHTHIAYAGQESGGSLRHAAWNGTAWNVSTVDNTDGVSCCTAIALNASGYPFIGYQTGAGPGKLVAWNGTAWETLSPASDAAFFDSLAFDSLGRLHAVDSRTYRIWDGGWTNESLPGTFGLPETFGYSATVLALDGDLPRIAYVDAAGDLYYARAFATPLAPTSPRNLQALGSDGQVTLTWTAPAWDGGSPITGYRLYRSTPPTPYDQSTTPDNLTTWTDTSVTNGLTYYYRVAAVTAIGEGPPSNEVTVIPSGPGDDPPTCLIIFPTGGTVSGVEIVQGTATDPESSLDRVEVRVDSEAWTPAAGTAIWVYAWNSSLVVDGAHTIEARASDGTQYSAVCSASVTTDNGVAPPDGTPRPDFIRDYGWVLVLLIMGIVAAVILLLVRRRRDPAEPGGSSPP